MKKYIICISASIISIFFLRAPFVYAGFEITEFMYDLDGTDTDREWVEVRNTGSEAEDLSAWFLFAGNAKHVLVPEDSSHVDPGGYAIIAQNIHGFKTDWPSFNGLLFDSSWTGLNNEQGNVALKDPDLNILSSVNYTKDLGGSGDGNSLQKSNSLFLAAIPTPGKENNTSSEAENKSSPNSSLDDQTENQNSSHTNTPAVVSKKEIQTPKTTVTITAKKTAVAGIPFALEAIVSGYNKEYSSYGKFVWNFGDGMTKEEKGLQKLSHVYQYPGEYVLDLSYYENYYADSLTSEDQVTLIVIPSDVSISSVGDITDPFVEVQNNSSYEIPLSGWIIKGMVHFFVLPQNTILLSKKKLKISSRLTLFDSNDLRSVILKNQNGEAISTYTPSSVIKTTMSSSPKGIVKSVSVSSKQKVSSKEAIKSDSKEPIDLTKDTSRAQEQVKNEFSFMPWVGLGGIIILGVSGALFLGRHKPADNEEVVDNEEIHIDEIEIMDE
jgi:hypothetical protein